MQRADISTLATGFVPSAYIEQGVIEIRRRDDIIKTLLSTRSIPTIGWSESTIEYFLTQLSFMDSNNFSISIGGGEREGRVISQLVRRRHYGFAHGIGRSGDVVAIQPKAAGSSLLYRLTNRLTLHALRLCGLTRTASALVLPTATGLSLTIVLLALAAYRKKIFLQDLQDKKLVEMKKNENKNELVSVSVPIPIPEPKIILWCRIDQKSCFKSLLMAGFIPKVIPSIRVNDELRTNLSGIEEAITQHGGAKNILAIVTTTSCFAPRIPDDVVSVAKLCDMHNIPHIVNNAYGLQASSTSHALNESFRCGRVDAVISSTDKNFLVPVGGAIVYSPKEEFIDIVARSYPGRASMTPILDLFITLLELGTEKFEKLLLQRKNVVLYLRSSLQTLAERYGERLLDTKGNPISLAMTLDKITSAVVENNTLSSSSSSSTLSIEERVKRTTYFGSMLFSRGISGCRVVHPATAPITIDGYTFLAYGAHIDDYPHAYVTVAAAIGLTTEDVDHLMDRMGRTIDEFIKQKAKIDG